ncbi:hypothetical protein FACS1894190_11220 [Spirochaetia bacterium]|nr:hypothetical protein FACS1894190_11220 [Spirochaetia bacterium]
MTNSAYYAYSVIMKFQEIERIIRKDGWALKDVRGSHYQYIHSSKSGKVTIPFHSKDIAPVIIKSILKQAGMNYCAAELRSINFAFVPIFIIDTKAKLSLYRKRLYVCFGLTPKIAAELRGIKPKHGQ